MASVRWLSLNKLSGTAWGDHLGLAMLKTELQDSQQLHLGVHPDALRLIKRTRPLRAKVLPPLQPNLSTPTE